MLSDLEGEPVELNLMPDIVTRALKIQEGNHNISSMKLNPRDWLVAFIADNVNDSVYATLCVDEAWLAQQIHQPYFHIYKPQMYTHLDAYTTFLFSMAVLKKQQMKADWGVKKRGSASTLNPGPKWQRSFRRAPCPPHISGLP